MNSLRNISKLLYYQHVKPFSLSVSIIFLDSFDVYVSSDFEEIFLVDLNPFTENNCFGLFQFTELQELAKCPNAEIVFRCIEKNEDTIIGMCERNFLPIDLLNAGTEVNNIDFNNFPQ